MAKKRKVARLKEWRGMRVRYLDASWLRSLKKSRLSFEVRGHPSYEMHASLEIVGWSALVFHPDEPGIIGQTTTRGGKTPLEALERAHKDLVIKLSRAKRKIIERQRRLSLCLTQAYERPE